MAKEIKHANKVQQVLFNAGKKVVGDEAARFISPEAVRQKGTKRLAKIALGVGLSAALVQPATKLITARAEAIHPPEMTIPAEGEAHREYTVKSGDTAYGVAKKYMPKGADVRPMVDVINRQVGEVMNPGEHVHIPNPPKN